MNTILVKKYVPKREERAAGGNVTPGHIVMFNSSDQLVVHSTAGGEVTPRMVAVEDKDQGRSITQAYATTGDSTRVQAEVLDPGDIFLGRLKNGETVVIGDKVESAGDGTLQKFVADSGSVTEKNEQIVGIAVEAKDMSGSSAADPTPLFKVMAI